jgi:hypothetical protein
MLVARARRKRASARTRAKKHLAQENEAQNKRRKMRFTLQGGARRRRR